LFDWLTQITVLNIERENEGTDIKGKLTTHLNPIAFRQASATNRRVAKVFVDR
jgi:hypothetical protein